MLSIFPFCPNSPRRLYIEKKDPEEARRALIWLRRTENVDEEMTLIQTEMDKQTHDQQVSIFGIFRDKYLRSTIWLCVVVMVARQFSGYAVICNYSTAIFTGTRKLRGTISLLYSGRQCCFIRRCWSGSTTSTDSNFRSVVHLSHWNLPVHEFG